MDNINRSKSKIVKWMWIQVEMQSNISCIALTIVSIDIKAMTIYVFGNLLICLTNVLHVTLLNARIGSEAFTELMLAFCNSCNKSQYLFITRPMLGKEGHIQSQRG